MYKYKSLNDGTLVYPTGSLLGRVTSAYSSVIEDAFDYTQYENNGSVIVDVSIDNIEVSGSDILTAYIDGEIRGQVNPQLFPLTNEYLFGMMVYGDDNSDNIEFEYYNYFNGKTYALNHDLVGFESDMIVGSYLEPYTMDDSSDTMPSSYSLDKAYPNPFNPTTTINYEIPFGDSHVNLSIYDLRGRLIEVLVDQIQDSQVEPYSITWNAEGMSSGIYFVRLHASNSMKTQKIMLVK